MRPLGGAIRGHRDMPGPHDGRAEVLQGQVPSPGTMYRSSRLRHRACVRGFRVRDPSHASANIPSVAGFRRPARRAPSVGATSRNASAHALAPTTPRRPHVCGRCRERCGPPGPVQVARLIPTGPEGRRRTRPNPRLLETMPPPSRAMSCNSADNSCPLLSSVVTAKPAAMKANWAG